MITILLTRGKIAYIDDEDFELVSQYKWRACRGRNTFYASTNIKGPDGIRTTLAMHRLIIHAKFGQETDHKDHNGLNNQRYNLRFCSNAENLQNSKKRNRETSSIYKGVYWNKEHKKFLTRITVSRKITFIGYFIVEAQAAKAYNKAAIKYFGKFANLNIIRSKDEDRGTIYSS